MTGLYLAISPGVIAGAPTNLSTLLSNTITGGVGVALGVATTAAAVMSRR